MHTRFPLVLWKIGKEGADALESHPCYSPTYSFPLRLCNVGVAGFFLERVGMLNWPRWFLLQRFSSAVEHNTDNIGRNWRSCIKRKYYFQIQVVGCLWSLGNGLWIVLQGLNWWPWQRWWKCLRAGEVVLWLRMLTALPENLCSLPSNSSAGLPGALFWPRWVVHLHEYTHIRTHVHSPCVQRLKRKCPWW